MDRSDEPTGTQAPRSVSSRDLMGGARVLVIHHGTAAYRLQVTTAGKLILTE